MMEEFSSIQIYGGAMPDVYEALVDMASRRKWRAGRETDSGESGVADSWEVIVLPGGASWITVLVRNPAELFPGASDFSRRTGAPVLALQMELPVSWRFRVFSGGDRVAAFEWAISGEAANAGDSEISRIEEEKLRSLGVAIPRKLREQKGKAPGRIRSADPYLELRYRRKLSGNRLVPEAPDMPPELPKTLATLFPGRAAFRFRKILGEPHLTVEQMAAAFVSYLEIETAFETFETALETRDLTVRDHGYLRVYTEQ